MKIKLIGKKQVINLMLPKRVYGNYWITNEEKENLINVEASEGKWIIKSNSEIKIIKENTIIEEEPLEENKFYEFFDTTKQEKYLAFVTSTFDGKMLSLDFVDSNDVIFTIGNSDKQGEGTQNYISYSNNNIDYNQIEVSRQNNIYYIKNLNPNHKMFVNNFLSTECYLSYGDVVFIEGLSFSFVGNILMLGVVDNKVKYATNKFSLHNNIKLDLSIVKDRVDSNVEVYNKNDYFIRPPRFNEVIEKKEFTIDSPPTKPENEYMPVFLTLGPMIIMGMSSSVSGSIALIRVISKQSTFQENYSSIITAVSMLIAMIVFPVVTKAYQKNLNTKKEKLRNEKYIEYLNKINKEIQDECIRQRRILIENNVSLKEVGDIILYKKRNLWERKITYKDFLALRLGIGNIKPYIDIKYPQEHFKVEEDNLEEEMKKVIASNSVISEVPVVVSFREKFISAFIGKQSLLERYMDGIILQLMAYHSYDELKIVIFTNEENKSYWKKLKNSPYVWDKDDTQRYFAYSSDDMLKISNKLEEIFSERKLTSQNNEDSTIYNPHYLIITDDIALTSKLGIINNIQKSKKSYGFSLMYLTDKLNALPSECSTFISIEPTTGGVFENILINKKQEFIPDFVKTTIDSYIFAASNIPIEQSDRIYELPTTYSFLEMYDAGNVEQLNAFNRWQTNDPTASLSCPVGVNENGELFKLDLHEKVHGPHGLIAGMTGSGKSEFIITYILSMAVNYDPKEVQFVLIDYKGGGLAGAFENKETGEKLPHLAGTITNLDVSEINRSLSSLQSELKRRQRIFNEARDKCNESTIDIYKYQKLYREKKVDEPIAHLIIISDEFAELKAQQPEFMDELISTARIGRSLGVHLVLATQKPSGVVDEQIWSNTKFRVCLKVQDKSDSNDMLKNPDAAYLKETGRFYLQVGYNEFFAKGQSAWCGHAYYESEKRKKVIDNSISFVDSTGERIKNIDTGNSDTRGIHKGEEITNVLKYLEKIGKEEHIKVKQLWLDQIPANIFVDKLKVKYEYEKQPFFINPVIGEYDAPMEQEQNLLTIPFSQNGNLIVYGSIGSGKENLISTIIYSLISTYTPEEVNIYILDFGSEALKMYTRTPHVGGIVSSSEKDRIATLLKMLFSKMEERKKLFAEYNGSYSQYCEKSGKTVPTIITFINGYESYNEMYGDYADDLVLLTREGQKYGIYFVISVSATNNIRMKIAQNFNEKIALQMNDTFEYRQILGRTEVVPSKIFGRGLVKRNDIYEFQTAYPTEVSEIPMFIADYNNKLNSIYQTRANAIPTLPDHVTPLHLQKEITNLNRVPIGIGKDSLQPVCIDLKNQLSTLVLGSRVTNVSSFLTALITEIKMIKNTTIYVIDAEKILKNNIEGINYYSSSFEKVFTSFKEIIDKFNDIYINNDYDSASLSKYNDMIFIITGISKLKTILGNEFDKTVATPISTSKKLSKINYIITDSVDSLKKMEFDSWYKDIINNTRGVWIGNGLNEQNLLKIYSNSRSIINDLENNFGYNVISGIPQLIKLVEDDKNIQELNNEE